MNIKNYQSIQLTIVVAFVGYGLAQQFEGSSCTMHDGSKGTCKNVDHCESIKQGLRRGQLRLNHIVGCSFMGTVQIACCADETPQSNQNTPPFVPPRTNDFVFTEPANFIRIVNRPKTTTPIAPNWNTNGQFIQVTTPKPPKATTVNSFWSEWSANKPTNIGANEIDRHSAHIHELNKQTTPTTFVRTTTPAMDTWLLNILNEYTSSTTTTSTTTTPQSQINQNNHVPFHTTSHDVDELPVWMRNIFNELSTTTASNKIRFENDRNGDLHRPRQNSNDNESTSGQPTNHNAANPSTHSRYDSSGRKSEAACEKYSLLVPPTGIAWKIIGGSDAEVGEFPWMAAIGYSQDNSTFDCGGTIISDYYILTAAHCVPSRRPPIKVRLGKVNLLTNDDNEDPVDINVQEYMRHPDYKAATKKNDIALIRLAERIKFTDNIRPACLQTNPNDVLPNTKLYVTGWGSTSSERTVRPQNLLKTNVTGMPLEACNARLAEYNRDVNHPSLRNGIGDNQLCAYDPDARNDACQGDSGGPLQTFSSPAIGTVIGVVSFGISCGTPLPGIYTRVASYLDWIESIVWANSFNDV